MKRREFIALLSGAAVAWPRGTIAQQPAMPLIGFLSSASPDLGGRLSAFHQGLKEEGCIEGQNIAIEYRWRRATTIDCQCSRRNWFIIR